MPSESISSDAIRECLERSGYLLESRIIKTLSDNDYFVEPNQVVLDPRTGKSREIDFIAENCTHIHSENTHVETQFVGEVFNNNMPFVLITNRPSTPNANFESYVKFAYTPEYEKIFKSISIYEEREPSREHLFSQYCVISQKKNGSNANTLMASHPDDTYHSLQKLSEYVEAKVAEWWASEEEYDDNYWKVLLWHPMIVVSGELYSARALEDGSVAIDEIESGHLEFNWHFGEEPKTTVVEVIRFDSLLSRMNAIVASDKSLRTKIIEYRKHLINKSSKP